MKISIKLMFLLISLVFGFNNLLSMDEGLDNKPEKVSLSEDKEKNELGCIKTFEWNETLREKEEINISDEESFTLETFAELIEIQSKRGEEFILARVVTKKGNINFKHYFDAHELNKYLYGNYPVDVANKKTFKNPLNGLEIDAIDYFVIKTKSREFIKKEVAKYLIPDLADLVAEYDVEDSFRYLCSNFDLEKGANKEDLQNKFYLNCNNFNLHVAQGNKYYIGANYQQAAKYYERAGSPEFKSVNLAAWITSNSRLGNIYYYGKGLEAPNYKRARKYYERVSTPDCNIPMGMFSPWASINNNLGDIYYKNGNHKRAKECCERVATPKVNYMDLASWINSNFNMGNIYYCGSKSLKTDFNKAKEYYERIAKPEFKNENLTTWVVVNFRLGNIYSLYSPIKADYKKAIEYLEKVVEPEFKNVYLAAWADANINLGIIHMDCVHNKDSIAIAKKCWERVVSPEIKQVNLEAWIKANYKLGDIYYFGKGLLEPDYKKAIEYLEKLVIPELKGKKFDQWINANHKLSQIYLEDNVLRKPDYKKARECLERIIATGVIFEKYLKIWNFAKEKLEELDKMGIESSNVSRIIPTSAESGTQISSSKSSTEIESKEEEESQIEEEVREEIRKEFFKAISEGNIALVKNYIDQYPILVNTRHENSSTPLMFAVCCENCEMIQVLLGLGADRNLKNNNAKTALEMAQKIEAGQPDKLMTNLLSEKSSDFESKEKQEQIGEGFTKGTQIELFNAVENGNIELVKSLLNQYPNLLNRRFGDNSTLLISAVIHKKLEIIKILLEYGAIKKSKNREGKTALAIAKEIETDQSNQPMTNLLLSVVPRKAYGGKYTEEIKEEFFKAIENGNIELVKSLLDQCPSLLNARRHRGQFTPFMVAVIHKNPEIIKILLEYGAIKELVHNDGNKKTALDMAQEIEAGQPDKPMTRLLSN